MLSSSVLRAMLCTCEDFGHNRGLHFNAAKTQLICFFSMSSSSCSVQLSFGGERLTFVDSVPHLGHIMSYNLVVTEDIMQKMRGMVRKANCLLASFPRVGSPILSHLFQSYCLSLYGSSL